MLREQLMSVQLNMQTGYKVAVYHGSRLCWFKFFREPSHTIAPKPKLCNRGAEYETSDLSPFFDEARIDLDF